MSILQRSVRDLRGVGEQIATRLTKIGIRTFQDVLFHLPRDYIDRTRIHPIGSLRVADNVVIEGKILTVNIIPKPRRSLSVTISDGSGICELRFFYFNTNQKDRMEIGKKIRCFGQVRVSRGKAQLIHPEYKIFDDGVILPVEETLMPVYPSTEGISQKLLIQMVQQVLRLVEPISNSIEILPNDVSEYNFNVIEALQHLHAPPPEGINLVMRERLAFEELLAHHISLRLQKSKNKQLYAQAIIPKQEIEVDLPYQLTNAQLKTIKAIKQDLALDKPMMRLVQGDVGSGKTIVAVYAALQVIAVGKQAVLLAPTEILAEQHYENITKLLKPLEIRTSVLLGKMSARDKQDVYNKLEAGEINFLIGTHAVFQKDVNFSELSLIIIDEQHRFGVAQRLELQKKGTKNNENPHQLILTATPIPRTLAMTFYADMDYSIIDEKPPGRKAIKTVMISAEKRNEILAKISSVCSSGQQVYWVCTLIEESEKLDCTAAEGLYAEICKQLPNLQIGLVHGAMKPNHREEAMYDFKSGKINLLVSTTVIEVGVDVPNASLMVIENPERLGLAQLHQLRGRVGRGNNDSYCVLLYKSPLSPSAAERLKFLRDCEDGFALAEFDLEHRGPGELLGTRQTGLAHLKIANLVRDQKLLAKISEKAEILIIDYPQVVTALQQRWIQHRIEYAMA